MASFAVDTVQDELKKEECIALLPLRVHLPSGDITLDQIHKLWKEQEHYINHLEVSAIRSLKDVDDKCRVENSRREHLLLMRLTAKEQEIQELAAQVAELKSSQAPTSSALRTALLDPAVNILIQRLTKECEHLKKQAEDKQNELAAWKFTPDSATGKRLMAKCRQLYQENEDLGKMISSGRMAKLEGELALQKNLSEQMKQNQIEMDDFMAELDEDVEGMQSTILFLQQQLREAKDQITHLSSELGEESADKSGEVKEDFSDTSGDEENDTVVELDTVDTIEKRKLSGMAEEETEAQPGAAKRMKAVAKKLQVTENNETFDV